MGAAEIGQAKDQAGARDSDADLASPPNRDPEHLRTGASGRSERVGGDDCSGIAGERGPVGGKVAQQGGDESADAGPHGQKCEKADPILREQRSQCYDHRGADHCADHAEPALAQCGSKLRLAYDCRRGPSPERIVELQPERDVEGETD